MTEQEHDIDQLETCKATFKARLRFTPKKCHVKQPDIVYFGNVIGRKGVCPNPKKVKAIQDMQYPVDKEEMQRFLGIVYFLTRFVRHLSEKTADLWELLQKNAVFDMTPHYKDIFNKVKKAMASAKKLALYDVKGDLILEVDGSTKGLDACLMQGGQPMSCILISVKGSE